MPTKRLFMPMIVSTVLSWADPSYLVIPFASTSPEYGWAFGGKAHARDLFGGPGYGDLTGLVTTRSQYFVDFEGLRDSLPGLWRLGGELQGGVFPELYGGQANPVRITDLASFTPSYLVLKGYGGRWILPGVRMDVGLDFDARSIEFDNTASNPSRWIASDGAKNLRLTWESEWSQRDHPDDPRHGVALLSHAETSLPGSDQFWTSGLLQASAFFTPWDPGPTAALRLREERVWGTVPFWEIPYAGFSDILRGVEDRRVRGRTVQTVGTELREPFPLLGLSWQVVVFGELARAARQEAAVWEAEPVFAFGSGARLLLDDRHAILRCDLAWNTTADATVSPAIYVDFGQAF